MLCRVGCEFEYVCAAPTPAIAQVFPRRDGPHRIVQERTALRPSGELIEYLDSFGNRCGRLVMPQGRVTLLYDALVEITGEPDEVVPGAGQTPIEELPDDVI